MVTNYPHPVARIEGQARSHEAEGGGLSGRMVDRVRQLLCGLHGHDNLLQFERDRLFLRCVSCGHQSPGWELTEAPPMPSARAENRAALVATELVEARRIA